MLEKARALRNNDPNLYAYLARAYLANKNYAKSAEVLNEKLALGEDKTLRALLAETYKKQGNTRLYLAEKAKLAGLPPEKAKPAVSQKPVQPPPAATAKVVPVAPYVFLVAEKNRQLLSVIRFDGKRFSDLLQVSCTTGKNNGDKKKQGDLATPEGTFPVNAFIPSTKLLPKYGAGAYTLGFPDHLAQRMHKDGTGIWLHGTPVERPPYNSEGCVVVSDADFMKLKPFITPGKTFINICKTRSNFTPAEIKKVWNMVDAWKKAWESRNTEYYLSFYDAQFKSDGKDKRAWSEYKRTVNKKKKFIRIQLSEIQIFPYGASQFGNIYIAAFTQKYTSNDMDTTTRKFFYLRESGGAFKILAELVH